MAFDVHWDALDDGVAAQAQALLNAHFARVTERPAFLGPVHFHSLSFGTVPPVLELADLAFPLPEFYAPTPTPSPGPGPGATVGAGAGRGAERGEDDVQATVRFHYRGDLRLQLSTELTLNYPTDAFVALPVVLSVSSVTCSGLCVWCVCAFVHACAQ
jgi:mitochondrial distribution and morphology protein 12